MKHFVRINKSGPLYGCIGTTEADTGSEESYVTLLNSSIGAWFDHEELQPIAVGTRVLIEVEIRDFFENSMMIAGGWMSLTRIKDIVEPQG